MLPDNSEMPEDESFGIASTIQTSRTYRLDQTNKVINGICDEKESLIQALYKILNTEIVTYMPYDGAYGIQLLDLTGLPKTYVESEVRDRIQDAVLADDRFVSVSDFKSDWKKDSLHVAFKVTTVDGFDIESEATVNV